MKKLSSEKTKGRAPACDLELAKRLREFRNGLGVPQSKLAELLDVSRSQVAEWESGGNECPSCEKILRIAKLAQTAELRRWMLLRAGLDLDTIRRDFQDEVKVAYEATPPLTALQIPVFEPSHVFEHLFNKADFPEIEKSILIPTQLLLHPTSTICLQYGPCPPWSTNSDGIVVIDRAVKEPDKLLGRMVAILVTRLAQKSGGPRGDRDQMWAEPVVSASMKSGRRSSQPHKRLGAWLIVGRFNLDYDDDAVFEPGGRSWRLVLQLGLQATSERQLVLSRWVNPEKAPHGLERYFNDSIAIVGEVISWIKDQPIHY
jgi:transcriptional regulator with XRE-family HTH domain